MGVDTAAVDAQLAPLKFKPANAPSYEQKKVLSIMGIPVWVIFAVSFWLPTIVFITIDVILDYTFFKWLWW